MNFQVLHLWIDENISYSQLTCFSLKILQNPPIILKIRCLLFNVAQKTPTALSDLPLAFLLLPNTPTITKGCQCVLSQILALADLLAWNVYHDPPKLLPHKFTTTATYNLLQDKHRHPFYKAKLSVSWTCNKK